MKSSCQYEQWVPQGGKQRIQKAPEETGSQRQKANSESAISTDSGYEGLAAVQSSPVETIFEEEECTRFPTYKCTTIHKYSITPESIDEEDEDDDDYDEDDDYYVLIEMEEFEQETTKKESAHPTERTEPLVSNTAEQTAMNLYRAFRKQWTGVAKDEQLAARATIDALSCKHTVPEELETSVSLEEEIKLVKIRDAEDWSPLQFQIITTEHPYVKRDEAVALQKYRCPGCGTKIEPKYTSRLRYCDYLGKYFCNCCHYLTGSPIPGRIFTSWNFGKYCVSNFSKNLVDIIWGSRLFNLLSVSPTLYKKVKDLQRVKEVQQQLIHIRKLIMTCRFSHEVVKAFEKIPSHLTRELHLFTLEDLFQVRQRTLLADLRELLALAVFHVGECQLCQAKGFFCEFCQHSKVIFPFQIEIVRRCEDCKACYHKECFKTGDCPKCLRIKARQARMSDSLFTSSEEVDPSPTA
ncbi:hypothetical protein GDO78_000079 [Eleutherodactylus coqui]|uniref:Rubicon Homology domain-containing protein n=1 Tax=Eleutherodactylus coqui TaxID=57060 RepID=A0A8J6FQX7_ELECQ|nr:hypothetical protein GDO78_000079 [Eleutherodactylus coqui]